MKTSPVTPGTLRLHNQRSFREGISKTEQWRRSAGTGKRCLCAGQGAQFPAFAVLGAAGATSSCLWLKQSRPEERIRRNVSFFPIRVVRWGKIAACPPPISITRSKPTTLNHWHKSCSHLDRLHSGGGPNVNSRIRVIDADKGKGSQQRSRGECVSKVRKWTWRESHFLASLPTCSVIRQNEKIRGYHQAV